MPGPMWVVTYAFLPTATILASLGRGYSRHGRNLGTFWADSRAGLNLLKRSDVKLGG